MESENNKSKMDLITKYLAGEATPEDAMLLDDWLADSANKKAFDRAASLWNHLPGSADTATPRVQHAWQQLQPHIKTTRQKVRRMQILKYAAAACLLGVVIFISFLLTTGGKKDKSEQDHFALHKKSAGNQVKTQTMPDGSAITINRNSSVSYSSAFNETNREVELTGESYFNIMPDKAKPFIISVDDLKIKVIGTSFNVRRIPADESIEVQVVTGIVKMYTTEREITVVKGQTGVYSGRNHDLTIEHSLDINSIAYATKIFSFTDISFAEACRYLEKAFNVTIKLDAQKFADCRLTAQFHNNTLTYILDVINATLNTTYKQESDIIYINGNGCQ